MPFHSSSVTLPDGKKITLESGKMAKQAAGSAVIRLGDTVILATITQGRDAEGDFFPLTVEYREKYYAAGKIPGGYIKREAKPSDREVLIARIVDRTLRPLFPEGFKKEVQLQCWLLSSDDEIDCEALSVTAGSLAASLSYIPFDEPVAAVKVVGVSEGESGSYKYIVNPTFEQAETADIELVMSGTEESVVMVEGSAFEVPEEVMVNAIMGGHAAIREIVRIQKELIQAFNPTKESFQPEPVDQELFKKVEDFSQQKLQETFHVPMVKTQHYPAMKALKQALLEELNPETDEEESKIVAYFEAIEQREMRQLILQEQLRIDGRKPSDIRPIEIDTQVLPRAHGSALFQRGETQALVVTTLGTREDEQRVDSLQGEAFKNYMLHYNFPGFSVGEAKRAGSVSRREIGHGNLAERALAPVLPTSDSFPYTIRIVSDILESNGSSSMASVCGGSLSLMDAGVTTKAPVAGIAMGLICEGEKVEVLSDITGTEDHLGDMDFKVCGTAEGITAFQMDIKIKGITPELMHRALTQAKEGRSHILQKMNESLPSQKNLSKHAPCIIQRRIEPEKIKELIGPGGKNIRGIQETSGSSVSVDDEGNVTISSPYRGNAQMASKMIDEMFAEAEIGKIYKGKVKAITNFGAFVEIIPGKEGLVHISELANHKVDRVEDILSMGDELDVKCIDVDPQGKIRLSRKAALAEA